MLPTLKKVNFISYIAELLIKMLMTKPIVIGFLTFSAVLNCKKRRREVWTVRLPKNLSYTLQQSINNLFYLYEASVRRY